MTRPTTAAPPAGTTPPGRPGTGRGRTLVAPEVVARIAARAAREVPGVYAVGAPGAGVPAGVSVQVAEPETTVDLELVTRYGDSIPEVTAAVRHGVIDRVEAATGLTVLDVNITVVDVRVPGDDLAEAT